MTLRARLCWIAALALLPGLAVALEDTPTPAAQAAAWADTLASAQAGEVWQARSALLNLQHHAFAALSAQLDREELVKLQNTADLIYPGAERFYGHGRAVFYDIDWVHIRAGWVLEDLVRVSFGFGLGSTLTPTEVIGAVFHTDPPQLPPEKWSLESRAAAGRAAAARARVWLAENQDWRCLDALRDDLRSESTARQRSAIDWMVSGEGACEGLTRDVYTTALRPLVEATSRSADAELSERARRILRDETHHWLNIKGGL